MRIFLKTFFSKILLEVKKDLVNIIKGPIINLTIISKFSLRMQTS